MTRFDCTAQLAHVIWLSPIRCGASKLPHRQGISRISLQNIRDRGLVGGEPSRPFISSYNEHMSEQNRRPRA
jgi:hypothetical protein